MGFEQHVHVPTHGNSILDLVLSTFSNIRDVTVSAPLANSDHNVVHFKLFEELGRACYLPFPNFSSVDYAGLDEYFRNVDWLHLFEHYVSADDAYARFCNVVYRGLAGFVPIKFPKSSIIRYPPQIKNLLFQKERLFQELDYPLSSPLYKKVCSDVDYHLKKFAASYERRFGRASYERRFGRTASLRRLHLYLRNKLKPKPSLPILKDQAGSNLHNDSAKAEALGRYFASVFLDASACDGDVGNSLKHIYRSLPDIYFHPTDVRLVLKNLKPSTSEPFDGIPQIVFKKCCHSLCYPLSFLFNISFLLGQVPCLWKKAIITAIPKHPGAASVTDFRPISLTPTPAKVMEKIMFGKLLAWFQKFHLVPAEQHGFLPGASACTNLLDTLYDVCWAINRGKTVDIIHLDLSKAFDKGCYPKFINKLEHYGVRGKALDWIRSYLNDRSITVRVCTKYSSEFICTSGVPQGGVLSPLLFLIYTIELPQILKTCSDVHVQVYADDIKLYASYECSNREAIQKALELSDEKMIVWASDWDIPLNLSKCLVMHFGNSAGTDYIVNGIRLPTCDSTVDLGIIFGTTLKFSDQIDEAVKKHSPPCSR
nr:RNA-directed DNA polymerase (reverse transcriptase) domain containing protein [Haemonchus contortus]